MPINYLEFKLNKELAYEDTFEKDDKIRKEYEEYLERLKNGQTRMDKTL